MARKMLEATGPMRYGTRALQAGETFEADGPKARLLIGLGRAKEARARRQSRVTSEPKREPEPEADEITATDIRKMRKSELAAYLRAAGQNVDENEMGWRELLDQALAVHSEASED